MPDLRMPTEDDAERQLLELIRLQDAQNFKLSITCVDGGWTVTVTDPTGENPGAAIGQGVSFAEAWHRQDPAWK